MNDPTDGTCYGCPHFDWEIDSPLGDGYCRIFKLDIPCTLSFDGEFTHLRPRECLKQDDYNINDIDIIWDL